MASAVNIAARAWPVGTASRVFDTPPQNSTGYRIELGNRPAWPLGDCVRISVEISFDEGASWEDHSAGTFAGGGIGRNGLPSEKVQVAATWATVTGENGSAVVMRPNRVRVTLQGLQAINASLYAGWVV